MSSKFKAKVTLYPIISEFYPKTLRRKILPKLKILFIDEKCFVKQEKKQQINHNYR